MTRGNMEWFVYLARCLLFMTQIMSAINGVGLCCSWSPCLHKEVMVYLLERFLEITAEKLFTNLHPIFSRKIGELSLIF